MKKIFSLVLAITFIFAMMTPAVSAAPLYRTVDGGNITTARASLTIEDNGNAQISLTCIALSSATKISAKFYLEKKVGNEWEMVVFDPDAPYFRSSTTEPSLLVTRNLALYERGEYRVVAIYTVTAGTTETTTVMSYDTY